MNRRPFISVVAVLLTISFLAPSVFFIAPRQVHATIPVIVTGDIVGWIQETITAIATPISSAANVADKLNTYVFQPLAFILSGNLMKQLTASVIGFVIGKANGTGVPQFVVDVQRSMQTVADGRALAYLRQINQTNSPFSSSIRSALSADYLSKTSLAGFWAANMNTLNATSIPNYGPDYLNGNWSHGGVAAWFALTTQTQNNPYTLYNNAQSQLLNTIGPGVGGITGARAQELSWGDGFMSWCGTSDTATQPAGNNPDEISTDTYAAGNNPDEQSASGVNPGDPCTDKTTGLSGTIKTPGSVIKSTLDKVLGGQQDQINRMGNVGPQIEKILGDVGKIINTVNFASSLLGGDSGGLFGVNSTSGSSAISRLAQFAPPATTEGLTSGYAGVTSAQINQEAASSTPTGPGSSAYVRYTEAWKTISDAADTASTSVMTLADYCTTAANEAKNDYLIPPSFITTARAQAALATTTLANAIAPVIDQIRIASLTMEPTIPEIAAAIREAQTLNSAVADPEGSLTIVAAPDTQMTLVDKMNLLDANAQELKKACVPPITYIGG